MASQPGSTWSKPLFIFGTGLSAFTSGTIASLSLVTVPVILAQTTNAALLASWRSMLFTAGAIARPLAITAGITHAVNAYINLDSSSNHKRSKYLAAAALSTVAIVPFTLIFIIPTNTELLRQEELSRGTIKGIELGALALVKKWSNLNLTRAFLPAIGALAAFMTL